jgi:HAD superfamily hydrolase (TIGR01509 family)
VALRAIGFDLMDTVIRDPYREAIFAATGLKAHEAFRHNDKTCWPELEIGAIDEATFARRYFAGAPQLRFDLDAFHRARKEGYAFLPGMRELLVALRGRVSRHLASNYPIWIDEVHATFGFDELFEGVHASCHLHVRKPAKEFYEKMLARMLTPAGECLFVDDRAVNCEAAERAGMKAHVFDGIDGLRERLRAEGVDV